MRAVVDCRPGRRRPRLGVAMFAAAAAVAGLCGAFTACGAARPSGADAGGGLDVRAENAKLPGDCGLARLGTAHQVEGWFDRTSVAPGEPVRLFSSTTAQTLTVSVFRVGWYDGHGCRLVEHRGPLPGVRQPVPGPAPGTNTIATSWRQTTTFATSSWPAGDYLIRLDDADGWQAYVPLTVRGPAQPGRIVILNAVTTWQAYNAWGRLQPLPWTVRAVHRPCQGGLLRPALRLRGRRRGLHRQRAAAGDARRAAGPARPVRDGHRPARRPAPARRGPRGDLPGS
ncbi:exported hypothetical protein [Frankia sp. Hr75.2]|nr:exported hypothetical protein [Frankia sp. Hr75.2]